MALTSTSLSRVFMFQQQTLPDINPELSVEEIRQHYIQNAGMTSLSGASVKGPKHENGSLVYEFEQAVGYKG